MFSCKGLVAGCLWTIAAAAASSAGGQELSGADLERYCRVLRDSPQDPEAALCTAYLQGFIAAVMAANDAGSRVRNSADETFAERAARTRAGGRLRGQDTGVTAGLGYCVGSDVTAETLLAAVLAHFNALPRDADLSAPGALSEARRQSVPCEEQ